jgi:hypothetical protein
VTGRIRLVQRALARAAWALRDDVSFYGGLYIALATALAVPLVTADQRLSMVPALAACWSTSDRREWRPVPRAAVGFADERLSCVWPREPAWGEVLL